VISGTPLIDGFDNYAPSVTDAIANGIDVGVVRQRHMHDAALVRGHRFQYNFTPAGRDTSRVSLSEAAESLVATLLVPRHVHKQVNPVPESSTRDETNEELEGSQGLALTPDEQAGVVAVDIEDRSTDVISLRVDECNCGGHIHQRDQALQNVGGGYNRVGRLVEDRNSDLRGLSADSENSGLALANDVYFDVRTLDVELL
jgi:hypothetical protein